MIADRYDLVVKDTTSPSSSLHRRGFTLIELCVVLGIMAVLLALVASAVQRVRESASRSQCQNNLRQLGIALQGYHDAYRFLPPGTSRSKFPYRYMSWQTRILPYLEQGTLWDQAEKDFKANPQWARPPHIGLATVLSLHICPADGRETGTIEPENVTAAFTHYQGVSGSDTVNGVLFLDSSIKLSDIKDGASQTLMVGERPPSSDNHFGWWYAGVGQQYSGCLDAYISVRQMNQSFREPTCFDGPYHFVPGGDADSCDVFHFWSRHPGGANFLFADGSVHFLPYSADAILPALATRNGGDVVSLPF